ncbi:hypothetical protein FHR81_000694 [Actinoalloteichus hoggarensis]|uniref:Uncharacterized protein n=1 Tax=Actinoalloteichus hoggarensis TaxID=1470176 RepID=A0A221W1L5_9PSEU|nr:hypothetical protein AHOG_09920 [Actinoalloteichus hoggarensis]MBB5919665.1 hypothetical protein [Actinoalloteichus hoggarensis]
MSWRIRRFLDDDGPGVDAPANLGRTAARPARPPQLTPPVRPGGETTGRAAGFSRDAARRACG